MQQWSGGWHKACSDHREERWAANLRASRPASTSPIWRGFRSRPSAGRCAGPKSVSLATRQRIEAIARELNYTVDKNASSLRSQRANTIALLFFEDPTPDESTINPFFLAMLGAITRQCANRGIDLLISFQKMEDDWHVHYQDSHRADGLILLGYGDYTLYEQRLTGLVGQGTHFVRWGSVREDNIGVTVGSDNLGAGRLAGRAPARRRAAADRLSGPGRRALPRICRPLSRALRGAGRARDCRRPGACRSMPIPMRRTAIAPRASCCNRARTFDAIFAASDLIAIGAIRALAEAGRAVPGDVAVVGFDDIPAASHASPPLTTVMQDLQRAGELLVETLLAQVEDRELPEGTLPARLIVRKSSGAVIFPLTPGSGIGPLLLSG